MSFSAIWTRRLKYMLTPQWDLYARISDRIPEATWGVVNVLDYGCGIGFGALRLAKGGRCVTGVDKDLEAIEFAREIAGGVVFFCGCDATTEIVDDFVERTGSVPNRTFHVITVIEVVEHMERDAQALLAEKMSAVLTEDGTFFLSTPNKRSQFRKHEGHIGVHDPASLRALLEPRFSSVALEDYLGEPVPDDTTVSPLVAVCRGPK